MADDAVPHADVLNSTAQGQLKSIIDRVERLEVEKTEIMEQMKEVFRVHISLEDLNGDEACEVAGSNNCQFFFRKHSVVVDLIVQVHAERPPLVRGLEEWEVGLVAVDDDGSRARKCLSEMRDHADDLLRVLASSRWILELSLELEPLEACASDAPCNPLPGAARVLSLEIGDGLQ